MKYEELPDEITIGDKYRPAMKLTEQDDADQYFEVLVQHCMRFGRSRDEAESMERQNLGYFAGYYDYETMARVNQLFSCSHPVFGSAEQAANMSPKDAFELGREAVSREK